MAKQQEKGGGQASAVNIAKHLQGIDFPVGKQDLIEHAKKKGADELAMKMFNEMPDIEYKSVKDVMREYGKKHKEAA